MRSLNRIAMAMSLLVACSGVVYAQQPPNILLFIGDDVDFSYYGFQGHDFVRTPNLDRLARDGVVFDNGYASSSICRPALQTLLAGVQPQTWLQMVRDIRARYPEIPLQRESQHVDFTLPRLLEQAGYRSFAGGKMWEGTHVDAGFDFGTMVRPPNRFAVDGENRFGRDSMEELYDFIDDQNGPWFAWVAPKLPHLPADPAPELKEMYSGLGLTGAAVDYFANLTRMDRRLGEILEFLDRRGDRDDTVVIYLSDNGWDQPLYQPTHPDNQLGGDRGKGSVHDRGFRTPILIRWPEEIRPGGRSRRLVTFADVFETILDYAGAPSHRCSEGRSFRHLADNGRGRWEARSVVARMPFARSPTADIDASRLDDDPDNDVPIVTADFGLYLRFGRRWAYSYIPARGVEELYDLQRDPLGLRNLSEVGSRRLAGLRRRVFQLAQVLDQKRCSIAP